MKLNQAQQLIASHTWWSEECPGKWQYCYYIYSFADFRMYFHPDYLSVACLTVRDSYVQEKTPSDERLKLYDWLKTQYQQDHRFIDAEHERWVVVRDEVLALGEKIVREVETYDAPTLLNAHRSLMMRAIDSIRWGTFIECVDDYNSFVLPAYMAAVLPNAPQEERTNVMMVMSTPLIVSFMEDFQAEKVKLIFQYRDTIKRAATWEDAKSDLILRHAVEQLCDAYQWISVNYGGSPALTPETLFLQLHTEEDTQSDADIEHLLSKMDTKIERASIEQAAFAVRYTFPPDLQDDFAIMRSIGAWMDERKESMVKTTWYLSALLERMAVVTNVPKAALEWYTKEEIEELLTNGTQVPQQQIDARSHNSVFVAQWDGDSECADVNIFTGAEADELYRMLNAPSV